MNLHTKFFVAIGLIVSDKKIFKDLALGCHGKPEFSLDCNSLNNFQLVPPKDYPVKFGPNWPSDLGGDVNC